MNYHAQMPGQMSGQVPNQAGGLHNARVMDPDITRDRAFMQQKIFEVLMRRHPQTHEIQTKRVQDLVKRLEDGLFRSALSMEQYSNLDTLESRLHSLIKRPPMSSRNQQPAPSPVGTMIPTPGMSHSGNPNVMATSSVVAPVIDSTADSSGIAVSTVNTGSSLTSSTAPSPGMLNGSFISTNGFFSDGYQTRSTLISSTAAQRSSSQMIPTPVQDSPDGVQDSLDGVQVSPEWRLGFSRRGLGLTRRGSGAIRRSRLSSIRRSRLSSIRRSGFSTRRSRLSGRGSGLFRWLRY